MTVPKNPPRLQFGELYGRVYVLTRYTTTPEGHLLAQEKHDVTDDFKAIALTPDEAHFVAHACMCTADRGWDEEGVTDMEWDNENHPWTDDEKALFCKVMGGHFVTSGEVVGNDERWVT